MEEADQHLLFQRLSLFCSFQVVQSAVHLLCLPVKMIMFSIFHFMGREEHENLDREDNYYLQLHAAKMWLQVGFQFHVSYSL